MLHLPQQYECSACDYISSKNPLTQLFKQCKYYSDGTVVNTGTSASTAMFTKDNILRLTSTTLMAEN